MFNIKNLLLTLATTAFFSLFVFSGIKMYNERILIASNDTSSSAESTPTDSTETDADADINVSPSDSDIVIAKNGKKFQPAFAYNYKVKGKKYSTYSNSTGFKQTGVASWYGGSFHGRKTANGERFNMNTLTAAHKSLPLVTYAKVINLENNKSVVVKINDRGPFHGNRIIDLSRAAAQKLGMIHKGTTKVQVIAL